MARLGITDTWRRIGFISLRPADWLLIGWSSLAIAILFLRWLSGDAAHPGGVLAVHAGVIAGVVFMRWQNQRTTSLAVRFVTDFSPLGFLLVDYFTLMPVISAMGRPVADAWLAQSDKWLFGATPSLLLEPFIRPALTEVLMIAYSSFYLWPFLLAVFVYLKGDRQQFEFVELVMVMSIVTNFVFYMLYPACGPRYYLMDAYTVPLRGIWLGGRLVDAFFQVPVIFDCFPSGHTALSLLTVMLAYRFHRPYFWCILPVAGGIIAATIYGRFHYVIDVLFAVPFALAILGLSRVADQAYHTGRQRLMEWRRCYWEA